MKAIHLITLLLAACLWLGCGLQHQGPRTTNMSIVFDRTDSIRNYPATPILLSPFDLARDEYQGITITLTTISDKDINPRTIIALRPQNEWTSNIVERKEQISKFTTQVQHALDSMRNMTACGHSIVNRTVAREANALASSHADSRYLLVYSDLYELNDRVNFYRRNVLQQIRQHPEAIAAQFEKTLPLQRLGGIAVWLLYEPKSFADNNAFMPIATMYQGMLEQRGATVHIATQFTLP